MKNLYNGDPTGEFSVESSLVGPPKELPAEIRDQPNGSNYVGSLATPVGSLCDADLGSTVCVLYGGLPSRLRVRYKNSAGSGVVNLRVLSDIYTV